MEERDLALAKELVYGSVRWRKSLDFLVSTKSKTALDRIDTEVMILLRLTIYQMVMTRIPPHAAIGETMKLAGTHPGSRRAKPFINALLRSFQRGMSDRLKKMTLAETVAHALPGRMDLAERIATLYSYPVWMIERWMKNFGTEKTEFIASAGNQRGKIFFRLNSLKSKDLSGHKDVMAERFSLVEDGYEVTKGKLRPSSPMFTSGLVQPQDGASMIAGSLLAPRSGEVVGDYCCGKGVKSGQFASSMKNSGKIFSYDFDKKRIEFFKRNMDRLGVTICHPAVKDLTKTPNREDAGRFDAIFIDAPCSATGVIRRHPEIKWNRKETIIQEMAGVGAKIAEGAIAALKVGGRMIYAVCSIEPEEGREQIEKILQAHKNICRVDIRKSRPSLSPFITKEGDLLLLPDGRGMDGFFAAMLTKKS